MSITTNDFLSSTGFQATFNTASYPGLSCTITDFQIPAVSIGSGTHPTPRRIIPLPGDQYDFAPLNVTFKFKEDMSNYETLFNWLEACVETDDKPLEDKTSDIRISVFNNKNNLTKTFVFVRAFPTGIGAIQFRTTDAEDSYLSFDATFEYAYYNLE